MTGFLKFVAKLVFTLLFHGMLLVLALRGFTLLKAFGHAQGLWDAPPSLSAWDPGERIDAAEEMGRKYGGKP